MDQSEFREAAHSVVDLIADYLESVEDKALFPNIEPRFLARLFDEPLPSKPLEAEAVIAEVKEKFLPYCTHVNHPGYFGLITPTPTPMGIIGDLIASAMNQNIGTYTVGPSGVAMERRVVRWLTDLAGYDQKAGGNLTSGGMMANFIGMKLARDWASRDEAQHQGVQNRWAVYVSEERHVSVDKAVDAAGVGREALRCLPTDEKFSVRLDLLREAIDADQRKGIRPMSVIGLAGTTNVGSVDDLNELHRICREIGAWFHVDAAYGGGMLLSHKHPDLLRGLSLADSITIDPHKWFYAPLDAGAILVKSDERLTRSFGMQPAYLTDEMDKANERYQYYVHSFEQSRRLRALKVWMSFKRYGSRAIGEWIDQNVDEALRLYNHFNGRKEFLCATRPLMSAICVRFQPQGIEEEQLKQLHSEVARRIEESGKFWISTTVLKGKSFFRINPVNFRTRAEHMDALAQAIEEECKRAL